MGLSSSKDSTDRRAGGNTNTRVWRVAYIKLIHTCIVYTNMVVIFFASLGRLGMATLWISTGVQRSEANGPLAHGKRGDGGHRRVLGHAYVQPGGGEGE